jgi:hypothetical protein
MTASLTTALSFVALVWLAAFVAWRHNGRRVWPFR